MSCNVSLLSAEVVRRIQVITNIKVMCAVMRINILSFVPKPISLRYYSRKLTESNINHNLKRVETYTVIKLLSLGMYATRVITGCRFKRKLKVKLICLIISSISNWS